MRVIRDKTLKLRRVPMRVVVISENIIAGSILLLGLLDLWDLSCSMGDFNTGCVHFSMRDPMSQGTCVCYGLCFAL